MNAPYSLEDVFFTFDNYQFESGTLQYDTSPKDRATVSTIDRGAPQISVRDPKTVTHIFIIEVDLGSEDYKKLNFLANTQFYKDEPKANKIKKLVFNDGIDLKIVSNMAFFVEDPTRSYTVSAEKVSFTINAVIPTVEVKEQ